MIDTCAALIMGADRVRVSRSTLRVSGKTLEVE